MSILPCNISPSVTDRQFPKGNSKFSILVPLLALTSKEGKQVTCSIIIANDATGKGWYFLA